MSLKEFYNEAKKKEINGADVLNTLLKVILYGGVYYLLNLLWNYVAPVWGLPNMNYFQFVGTVFLFNIFVDAFSTCFHPKQIGPKIINMQDIMEKHMKDIDNSDSQ